MNKSVWMPGGLLCAVLMASALIVTGCKPSNGKSTSEKADTAAKSDSSAETATKTPAKDTSEAPKADKEGDQPAEPRTTTAGWWRILFSVPSPQDKGIVHDISAGFVKIIKKEDQFAVAELRGNDIFGEAEISKDSKATAKSVTLLFEFPAGSFSYQGILDDGVVRGNLQFAKRTRQNLVRLIPVTEADVTDKSQSELELGQTKDADVIHQAAGGKKPIAALKAGADQWSGNPAYVVAWRSLLGKVGDLELDDGEVKKLVEGYVSASKPWGERAVQLAKIHSAITMLSEARNVDYASSLLAEATTAAPKLSELWADQIAMVKEIAAVETAWQAVASGDAKAGLEKLQQLHKKNPAGELVTYRLASAERKVGSQEQAERLFATLAVLPRSFSMLSSLIPENELVEPRIAAAELYEQRQGSRKGFEEYLISVYSDTITNFLSDEQKNRAATENDRVVLVELFTGAMCPPCVAADVGTEAMAESFPSEDVVLLRYHVHIPGPDPLATSATEERLDYYSSDIRGTPTVLVDGTKVPFPVGGGYGRSEAVYESLAKFLVAEVTKPTEAELKASASVEGNDLRIHVEGATKGKPFDTVKLRVVIAENEIHFSAPNGILEHSMIVRGMPGGAEGIASKKGSYTFDKTVSLLELRKSISDYLDDVETRRGMTFPDRPADLSQLAVVAFLQDDVTHEVLQTVIVPIEQDIMLPPPEVAKEKKEKAEPAKEKAAQAEEEEKSGPELKGAGAE